MSSPRQLIIINKNTKWCPNLLWAVLYTYLLTCYCGLHKFGPFILTPFHFDSLRDGKVLAMFFCALFVSFIVISFFCLKKKTEQKTTSIKVTSSLSFFYVKKKTKKERRSGEAMDIGFFIDKYQGSFNP